MKKNYGFFFILICFALVACDDDDEPAIDSLPDTVSPVVEVNIPAANDSILVIDMIEIFAEVKDDKLLDNVRVVLTKAGGESQVLSDVKITKYSDYRNYTLNELHRIPQYAATGEYTVTVEAEDKGKNVTQNVVAINLHASDTHSPAFVKAFGNALFHSTFIETLDWFGYNSWDNGYSFDKVWLSTVLYLMVSTDDEYSISEAEWGKFITDFGVKNQAWATWDENNDGNLSDAEFDKGITGLNFFDDWDKNQDDLVHFEELAAGFFTLWDYNQDNVLSREEYQEKFYTYLYR